MANPGEAGTPVSTTRFGLEPGMLPCQSYLKWDRKRASMPSKATDSSEPSVSTRITAPGSAASSMMFMMLLALARMPSLMNMTLDLNFVAVSTISAAGRAWMPESLMTVSSLVTMGSDPLLELDGHGCASLFARCKLEIPNRDQYRALIHPFVPAFGLADGLDGVPPAGGGTGKGG